MGLHFATGPTIVGGNLTLFFRFPLSEAAKKKRAKRVFLHSEPRENGT